MARLLRVEWLKLRTTRLTYGLLALAMALTALDSLLRALRAGGGHRPPLYSEVGLTRSLTVTGFAMLIAWVLGVTISSGEFRHNTATLTYLAFPDRLGVLVGKTVVGLGAGALVGAAGAAVATGISLAVVSADGYPVALGTGTILTDAGGAIVGAALFAGIGVAFGSLIRSQVAVVIAIFVWAFFMESMIGGLFDSIDRFLPFTAATTLAGSKLGAGGFGFGGTSGDAPLPFIAATALVTGVLLLTSTLAAATTVRNDIS